MNCMSYAIDRIIKLDIPRRVLTLAFQSKWHGDVYSLQTLESIIQREVIDERVRIDAQIVHGTVLDVPLAGCERMKSDSYSSIFRVPKTLTQGRNILYPLHMVQRMPAGYGNTIQPIDNNGLSTGQMAINMTGKVGSLVAAQLQSVNSVKPVQVVSNALVYLINESTIFVRDPVMTPNTLAFRVMLDDDENFSHVERPYWTLFHELTREATKAIIYNNLTLPQDDQFIGSGGELGVLKDVISSYSDANERYTVLIEEWAASGVCMDPEMNRQWYQMHLSHGQ